MPKSFAILIFLCIWAFSGLLFAFDSTTNFTPIQQKNISQKIQVCLFQNETKLYTLKGNDTLEISAKDNQVVIREKKKTKRTSTLKISHSLLSISKTKKISNFYPGTLVITANKGKLTVINDVDIEEYLRGVVPYEIGKLDKERFEALKVQAVAARTYAYRHLGSRKALGFDVFADTRDQVYNGISGATPLTDQAIQETKGEILTYNGEPIQAYYHSTCGGHTESTIVWNQESPPYLKATPDLQTDGTPWCSESSYMKWERSFDAKTLASLFKRNLKEANVKNAKDFNSIRNIIIEDTHKGKRIAVLSVMTNKGSFSARGDKIRWLFKKDGAILPSSAFTIKKQGSEWVLKGSGFGHGIGMCQMGVRARAKAGQNYKDILEHYYPGVKIEQAFYE